MDPLSITSRAFIVVATLLLATPLAAPCQPGLASLGGIVVDSVHNVPLAQAKVRIATLGIEAPTGDDGHFLLRDIPPGTYRIDVSHPVITSLGLSVVANDVRLDTDRRASAVFAIPSANTIRRMYCGAGAPRPGSRGVLVGIVASAATRAPVEGATVVLSWLEVSFERGVGLTAQQRFEHARTGAGGFYSFCNLEDSLEALISAETPSDASTTVRISLDNQQLGAKMLLLPDTTNPATAKSVIRGRVANTQGRPVADARVEVMGFADSTRTRSDGSFRLPVPTVGTQTLRIRSVGYDEYTVPWDVTPADTSFATVELAKSPPSLATVFVRAKISDVAERTGFATRALAGPGRYITAADISRRKAPCLLDNIEWVLGFYTANRRACYGDIYTRSGQRGLSRLPWDGGQRETSALTRGGAITAADFAKDPGCLTIYIDDIAENGSDGLAALPPGDVVGIELYQPVTAPARYSGGNCAVILAWTTRYEGRRP